EINVKASILLLKDAAPHLHKGSSVVIISAIASFNPPASMFMYGVTKTALFGLTKALVAEMAPNTRVNCIAPNFVPTNFASFITSYQSLSYCSRAKDNFGRLHDRSKETPKVMKQLGRLFPNRVTIQLPQDETLLSDWKQQQERDVEIMKAQSNVVSIRT
ncbi:hypothetical protein S83_043322, partial [Arachis hypogaea]